jgi:hypothetical protein
MFKSLGRKLAAAVVALSFVAVPVAAPAMVSAQANVKSGLECGADFKLDTSGGCASTSGGTAKIQNIVTDVVNIFSIIVGIVAVIMIIVGGFKYITSGGDSGNITSAKNTIVYAVIGLVIVALAQFFVQFVLNKVQ